MAKEVEPMYCKKVEDPELLKKVEIAWAHVGRKGKEFFGLKEVLAFDPYVDWLKERVKTLMFPFEREISLYLQPTELQHDVPKERFYQVQLENRDLRQNLEDKKMEIYFLTEKKRDLARQLKEYEGESSSKKRPRAENSFVSTEEYQIALADAERNHQETLKFQMANNRNKAKVKELGNQFKIARMELEAKEDQMTEVLKENARL